MEAVTKGVAVDEAAVEVTRAGRVVGAPPGGRTVGVVPGERWERCVLMGMKEEGLRGLVCESHRLGMQPEQYSPRACESQERARP